MRGPLGPSAGVRGLILVDTMRRNRGPAPRAMLRTVCLLVATALLGSFLCRADQLQWNSPDVCARAANVIRPGSVLVSYCSLATVDRIEVWLVTDVVVVPTPNERYSEVIVLGRRTFVSAEAFHPRESLERVKYVATQKLVDSRYFVRGIDLAYVYVPTAEGSFRCLGLELQLPCFVKLEEIRLPDRVLSETLAMGNLGGQVCLRVQ